MPGTMLLAAAQPMYDTAAPSRWGYHMMSSPLGGLFMLLLVVVAIGSVALVLRGTSRKGAPGTETPLDILKRRYAAGEIDKDQYERMKRDLSEE